MSEKLQVTSAGTGAENITNNQEESQKCSHPPQDKDYPQLHQIKSIPLIQYRTAGDLVKDVHVILVTATETEFRAVMGQAKPLEEGAKEYHKVSLEDHTSFYLAKYGKNKVAIIRTDQDASETVLDQVQRNLKAEYVIAVGICYGLKEKKVKLGDIIISSKIIQLTKKQAQDDSVSFHQAEKKAGTLSNVFKMGEGFELKKIGDGPDDYVHIYSGEIVSERTLINDPAHQEQVLKQIPCALGVEMEGSGIIKPEGAYDFQWIVIKAVANWVDENSEKCTKWQSSAAVAAAKYIKYHLSTKEFIGSMIENQPTSTEDMEIRDPPGTDDKDYPKMHEIQSKEYSAAGDLVKDVHVILVTATETEFRAVMGQAKPLEEGAKEYHKVSLEDHTSFYLAKYGKNKVAIIRTDQGARETRRVLDKIQGNLKAVYVIGVGICYGLRDERKVKLGDVIVSSRITDITKKRAHDGSVVFHQAQNMAGTLYNFFKMGEGFALKSGPGDGDDDYVHICPGEIVSESTLVNDQKYKERILKQIPYALGGEMEGAGIVELAGVNHDFQGIVIKAVADWGDGNKETCKKWQPFAAVAAAKYVKFHFEKKELKDQLKEKLQQENYKLQREKDQLQQDKNRLQQEKDQLQQDKDQLQQEKDQLQQDNNQLPQENSKLQQDQNQLLQEKDQLQQKKDQLPQENSQLQQEKDQLQQDNDQLPKEKIQLQQEKDQLQHQLQQKKDLHVLQRDIDQLQQEKDQLQHQLQQEKDQLQQEKDQLQQKKDQLPQENSQLQQEKDQLQQDNDQLPKEKIQLQQEKDQLQHQLQQKKDLLQRDIDQLQQEKDQLQQEKDQLQQEKDQLQQEKDQLQQEKDQLQQEKDQLQQEKDQLQKDKDQLQKDKDQLQKDKDQLQKDKDQLHQEKL